LGTIQGLARRIGIGAANAKVSPGQVILHQGNVRQEVFMTLKEVANIHCPLMEARLGDKISGGGVASARC
jgi:hypothetical protein